MLLAPPTCGSATSDRPCRCLRRDGLTLVELLIAVSLFSLIGASATELVRANWTLQARFDEMASTTLADERALAEMAGDLEQMRPLYRVPFVGQPQQLEYARVEPVEGGMAWRRVVYRMEFGMGEMRLVRETFAAEDPFGRPLSRRVLLGRLNNLRIEFGWRHPMSAAVVWQSPWPAEWVTRVPGLIRVQAELRGRDAMSPVRLERIVRNPAGLIPEIESP